MGDQNVVFILDSYAFLAYYYGEPGGPEVHKLLQNAPKFDGPSLYMSMINVGEIYYLTYKRRSRSDAENILADLIELPISFFQATDERILAAAKIKAQFQVSYADAFAIALALEFNGRIVTGDPEFTAVEPIVQVYWL